MKAKIVKTIVLAALVLFPGCYSSIAIKNFNPQIALSEQLTDFDSLEVVETLETYGSLIPGGLVLHGEYLFAGDFSGRVYAFDINGFKEVGYASSRNTTISCAPLISDDKIYYLYRKKLLPEMHLVKYDLRNGKEVLDKETGISGEGTLYKFKDEIILITEDKVIFFDSMFVESSLIPLKEKTSCILIQSEGMIYIGCYSGSMYEFDLIEKTVTKLIPGFTESIMTIAKIGDNFVVALADGRLIYAGGSGHHLWEIETGKITASPLIAGGYLYVGTLSGIVMKISIKTGEITSKFDTGGLINLPLTSVGDKIFVPVSEGKLLVLGASRLELVQSMEYEGRIRTSVVGNGNLFFLGYDNGKIGVLKPNR